MATSNPTGPGVYSLINYSRKENGQIRRLSSLTVEHYGANKPFVLSDYIFTGLYKQSLHSRSGQTSL